MTIVTLNPKQIDLFKRLTSTKSDGTSHIKRETSGRFTVDPSNGKVQVSDFALSENQTSSKPPTGAVTFHTHNVPPQHVLHRYMSTDVPSWQDFKLVAMDSLFGNLQNHVIFTPNFTYVVGVSAPLRARLLQFDDRSSAKNRILALTQHEYHNMTSQHGGTNQGKAFLNDWVQRMQEVGFMVQRVRSGEPVTFDFVQAIGQNHTSQAAMAYQAGPIGEKSRGTQLALIFAVVLLLCLAVST